MSATPGAAVASAGAFLLPGGATIARGENNGRRPTRCRSCSRAWAERSRASPSPSFKRKDGSAVELVPAEAEGGLALGSSAERRMEEALRARLRGVRRRRPRGGQRTRRARRGARKGGGPLQARGPLGRIRREAARVLSRRIRRRPHDRVQARRGDGGQRRILDRLGERARNERDRYQARADEVRGARHGRGRVLPGGAEQVLEGDAALIRRHGRLGRGADEVFPERARRVEGEPGLGHARPPRRAGQGLRRVRDRLSVPRGPAAGRGFVRRGTSGPST